MSGVATTSRAGLNAAEAMAARLKALFVGRKYAAIDPPMLLSADIVLDRLGEDIRRRLLLVASPDGREMCLRPDFTLPVARAHLDADASAAGRYAYAGLAFRFPGEGDRTRNTPEFLQAGIEHFGDDDAEAADAEILETSVAALADMGLADITVTLGDVAIFNTAVDAMALGVGWEKRLRAEFRRREQARGMMGVAVNAHARDGSEKPDTAFAEALADMDVSAARAVVEDVMSIAGTAPVGGRKPQEIAERFVEQAHINREDALDEKTLSVLEKTLAIRGAPEMALNELREVGRNIAGLTPAIDRLARRLDLLKSAGVDMGRIVFDAGFSGRIEYYTGMVFDIRLNDGAYPHAITSGGRYDSFLTDMGARSAVPAVGASVYVSRLINALEGQP